MKSEQTENLFSASHHTRTSRYHIKFTSSRFSAIKKKSLFHQLVLTLQTGEASSPAVFRNQPSHCKRALAAKQDCSGANSYETPNLGTGTLSLCQKDSSDCAHLHFPVYCSQCQREDLVSRCGFGLTQHGHVYALLKQPSHISSPQKGVRALSLPASLQSSLLQLPPRSASLIPPPEGCSYTLQTHLAACLH